MKKYSNYLKWSFNLGNSAVLHQDAVIFCLLIDTRIFIWFSPFLLNELLKLIVLEYIKFNCS